MVAVAVSWVVDTAARTTRRAAQAGADAQTLATVAGSVLRGARPLTALLERLRETFRQETVTLLERDGPGWTVVASVGGAPCPAPSEADAEVNADDRLTIVMRGPALRASDRRIVEAFAAQAALAVRQERLAAEAAAAKPLAEADKMHTALLAAVSHDLRTPLAAAKAAVAGLAAQDVHLDDEDRAELLATADESLDKLDRLVANLLDMSRLQAGALGVHAVDLGAEDVVPRALDDLGVTIPLHLPSRPARRARRPRPARTHPGQPRRQRTAAQPGRPAAGRHRQRAGSAPSRSGSSTTARASRRTGGRTCSCRSSGSATATTTPASGSASHSPAGSPRSWAAR
nr:hypothetical protein GCM10020092_068650 [Actinoplanes digitatis]